MASLAAEFRLDQGPHDLQAQAGMGVEAEALRQARPVVLHADRELPRAPGHPQQHSAGLADPAS